MRRIMIIISDEEFDRLSMLARDTLRTTHEETQRMREGEL